MLPTILSSINLAARTTSSPSGPSPSTPANTSGSSTGTIGSRRMASGHLKACWYRSGRIRYSAPSTITRWTRHWWIIFSLRAGSHCLRMAKCSLLKIRRWTPIQNTGSKKHHRKSKKRGRGWGRRGTRARRLHCCRTRWLRVSLRTFSQIPLAK